MGSLVTLGAGGAGSVSNVVFFAWFNIATAVLLGCYWLRRWHGLKRLLSVPGSLQHAYHSALRRRYRWPGFAFWPLLTVSNLNGAFFAPDSNLFVQGFNLVMAFVSILYTRWAWKWLLEELAEDEDDPWNKGKRGLKRLKRKAARTLSTAAGAVGPKAVPA